MGVLPRPAARQIKGAAELGARWAPGCQSCSKRVTKRVDRVEEHGGTWVEAVEHWVACEAHHVGVAEGQRPKMMWAMAGVSWRVLLMKEQVVFVSVRQKGKWRGLQQRWRWVASRS